MHPKGIPGAHRSKVDFAYDEIAENVMKNRDPIDPRHAR